MRAHVFACGPWLACGTWLAGALSHGALAQSLPAPDLGLAGSPQVVRPVRQYVSIEPAHEPLRAGRLSVLHLGFRVDSGFHVNSHTPHSELQIPTRLEVEWPRGWKAAAVGYPAGKPYKLADNTTDTLDVYTDAFVIEAPVTAPKGSYTLAGALHYQACDHAACYPPKTLTFTLPVRVE